VRSVRSRSLSTCPSFFSVVVVEEIAISSTKTMSAAQPGVQQRWPRRKQLAGRLPLGVRWGMIALRHGAMSAIRALDVPGHLQRVRAGELLDDRKQDGRHVRRPPTRVRTGSATCSESIDHVRHRPHRARQSDGGIRTTATGAGGQGAVRRASMHRERIVE